MTTTDESAETANPPSASSGPALPKPSSFNLAWRSPSLWGLVGAIGLTVGLTFGPNGCPQVDLDATVAVEVVSEGSATPSEGSGEPEEAAGGSGEGSAEGSGEPSQGSGESEDVDWNNPAPGDGSGN